MDAALAWTIGVLRALTGVVLLAAPGRTAERWTGTNDSDRRVLVRGIGGRDLAIGLGLCAALQQGRDPGPWLLASVAGDVADAGAALSLDDEHTRTVGAVATGFGVLGAVTWALGRRG